MLYTASFYLTNETHPAQHLHGPSPAQTAQLLLAEALGEEVPEAALQDVQRALDRARSVAEHRQLQRASQKQGKGA
jgi:hypothetical protein